MNRKIHVLYADGKPVVATPDESAFNYCRAALELEARHVVTHESLTLQNARLPAFIDRRGSMCWVHMSLFNVVEHMRELLSDKPAAVQPW